MTGKVLSRDQMGYSALPTKHEVVFLYQLYRNGFFRSHTRKSYEVIAIISFSPFLMMFGANWNLIGRNTAKHNVLEDLDTDGNKQNLTW